MARSEPLPSPGALQEVRHLAGPSAVVLGAVRLEGGQHADTWRVDTENPATSVVVRQFPAGDPAAAAEQRVLRALDGLGGLAPAPLGIDLDGRWSEHPTSLTGWLDGQPDIDPADPDEWARELARGLAAVHAVEPERLAKLPSVADRGEASEAKLTGPLAAEVRSRWPQLLAAPQVLTHGDYWSGNVVWRGGKLTGIVDWSSGARGPRGYDLAWCRLDLVLLFDERTADVLLAAYEEASGQAFAETRLWDRWAAARAADVVGSWAPNYQPLGRPELGEDELRRRHARWTERLLDRA